MAVPKDLDSVQKFLEEYRCCCGRDPLFRKDDKYRRFIDKSDITKEEILSILFNELNEDHCQSGPKDEEQSDHLPGAVCIFHYPWSKFKIYIKLKIPEDQDLRLDATICLSFHEVGVI